MRCTEQELIDLIQNEYEWSLKRHKEIVRLSGENCYASGREDGYREALMKIKYAIYDGLENSGG